jgi:hypothetical protein
VYFLLQAELPVVLVLLEEQPPLLLVFPPIQRKDAARLVTLVAPLPVD